MTQPCPSNHREQVIFGGFSIHVHCDRKKGLLIFVCVVCALAITRGDKVKSFLSFYTSSLAVPWIKVFPVLPMTCNFECIRSCTCSSLRLWLCSSLLTPFKWYAVGSGWSYQFSSHLMCVVFLCQTEVPRARQRQCCICVFVYMCIERSILSAMEWWRDNP